MRLHRGPLGGDNAINTAITDVSVWQDLIAAQNSVKLRAQALNGATACMVEEMRAQLHANAIQGFKSVREQKQLALCVERRALHAFAVPCSADLHAPVRFIHIPVTGHAHNFGRVQVSHGEGKHCAMSLAVEPAYRAK
jgi:hypothetical protein